MKTVTFIHSYPGATETLRLLWDGFKRLGWPIIGVETIDGVCEWPEPIQTIKIGANKWWLNDRRLLPIRLINTLRYFLLTEYDRCCIVEYDTAIFGPLPQYPPGLVAHRGGGQLPDSDASFFLHTPWIIDRETAEKLVPLGLQRISDGTCEKGCHGSPDVFLALLVEQLGIEWHESGTFSANTIEGTFVEPARAAYAAGCPLFHGVKTRQQLDAITK